MTKSINNTSLPAAALVAGIAILTMVICAPFAEIYAYPKLVVPGMAEETTKNITANKALFISAIFGYLITFICDLLASWALYILLKPVNENLSLLTAWFRLVYTIIALVALLNLVTVLWLINNPASTTLFDSNRLNTQVQLHLITFKSGFHFGILFFSIHLGLLGYLVFRSKYIPRIMGVLLIVSGFGYLMTSLKPFLFPTIRLDFAVYTFYGELIFMLWLLIKGSRIQDSKPISV